MFSRIIYAQIRKNGAGQLNNLNFTCFKNFDTRKNCLLPNISYDVKISTIYIDSI